MCGIAGFIDDQKNLNDLQVMTRCLRYRGPDDEGYYYKNNVGLGHRRLSIIDLSANGHQPMFFKDLTIIFNGEIYNYLEIKSKLINLGYEFFSNSDTEVVIKAFHHWREKCVDLFIGMFAFAIYEEEQKSLFLFRDRVGVKPLYYYHYNNRFAFCSELKALKGFLDISSKKQLDEEAISSFFRFGYVSNNRSIIKNVFKVPPGHYLVFQNNNVSVKEYWNVSFEEDEKMGSRSENDLLDELEEIAVSAFKYRMVSDVPVGVFLSAGIDSSLVAAILSQHYGTIQTFTIGFEDPAFDESADAKRIANFLETNHTEAILYANTGRNILNHFYDIYDEPHGDNSCIPTTFVSSLAKQNGVKVVLSADGGDELFGGYSRYNSTLGRWHQVKTSKFKSSFLEQYFHYANHFVAKDKSYKYDRFKSILRTENFSDFYQMLLRPNSDAELSDLLMNYIPYHDKVKAREFKNQMMEWDFYHYLPDNNLVKVDRATMFNGIEGREPFLDHRLIEFASKLPLEYKIKGSTTKYLLKKLLNRYLPLELYDLPKRGFGAPLQQWLRNNYETDIRKIFDPDLFQNDYLNKENVLSFIKRYHERKDVNMVTLWLLYSFQKWYNKWNDVNEL